MATAYPGGQSPTTFSKTLERVFEDAQHTGEVILNGRKIKEYPNVCQKFDLVDTIFADLSKNRLTELPTEVCEYTSMERLNCYHNVMRSIPEAIVQLQALTHLNLSRNMLCTIPPFICRLQALEVLTASNNKLVSLPEELGQLEHLMDLDVSCNEINCLPSQIGDLESLRVLNIRRNLLIELPAALSKLQIRRLDFSENRISNIPTAFKNMEMLEDMVLDHNPLTMPPAHVCKKGRVHIMKFLQIEALKEDRKRGMLTDTDMKRLVRKSLPQQPVGTEDFKHINDSPGRKRHTVVGNDSGYNTTDSNEKCNWSPMEVINDFDEINALALKAGEAVKEQRHHREIEAQRRLGQEQRKHHPLPKSPLGNHVSDAPTPPPHQTHPSRLHLPPSPQIGRPITHSPMMTRGHALNGQMPLSNSHSPLPQSRSAFHGPPQYTQSSSSTSPHAPPQNSYAHSPTSPEIQVSPPSGQTSVPEFSAEDAFTRELQRQKADYEMRKKKAEQIRMQQQQQQDEQERDERRRAALKLQEEQQRVLEQKRREVEARQNDNNNRLEENDTGVKPASQTSTSTRVQGRGQNSVQTPTQTKKKLENKRIPRPARRSTNDSVSSFIPIPVMHMNHDESHDTSPESPSMLPRKTTSAGNMREEKRTVAGSQYRRTTSDSQTGRMGRTANTDNHRNGIGEEKVKSAGPSPASSVSSIASNPRSTSSPRHTPAVRKVPIEDRRSTQSPVTRRTKPATPATTSAATTRTRTTSSSIASRTRTGGPVGSRAGNIARPNNMTPEEEFRMRHEAVVGNQRTQTQILRQRLEEEKTRILRNQKDAARETVLNFLSKRSVFNGDDSKHSSSRNNFTGTGSKNRQVYSTDTMKVIDDYKDSNPNFTIRRQQEHAHDDFEQLDLLRNHIESRLKVTLPDNLPESLRDGVVLCHLANQIRPRSVASIHVPSPAVPKLTLAKCRRNVENFLDACRKIGVGNEQICSAHDILDEKGIMRLVITVGSLVAIATNPKQSAV